MSLVLYNTLSRSKEEFNPIQPNRVTMYTCGPTVYNYPHIGNYKSFLFEDLLRRYLRYKGYDVFQVMNITDVDDKTIRKAIDEEVSLKTVTQRYTEAFFQDIDLLRFERAELYPRATDHIPEIIAMIQTLMEKGFAYEAGGSVYYSVHRFNRYGALARLDPDQLRPGASSRMSNDEYDKENVSDFVLWKAYQPNDGDVYWDSPFGKGRPGWHIECSAMSIRYLGETFDIHCGGIDHIFPHHTNEIAQSEAATDKPYVHYWMHGEFLRFGEKMSKSLGNVVYLKNLMAQGYSAQIIRMALTSAHYRMPLDFEPSLLEQAKSSLRTITDFIQRMACIEMEKPDLEALHEAIRIAQEMFDCAMDDDLNISKAWSAVFNLIREFNRHEDAVGKNDAQKVLDFLKRINKVLAVLDFESELLDSDIQSLIDQRNQARQHRDFKESDRIRDLLLDQDIVLEDTKDGVRWKRK